MIAISGASDYRFEAEALLVRSELGVLMPRRPCGDACPLCALRRERARLDAADGR